MKRKMKKQDKTAVYTDAQLAVLLKRAEIVLKPSDGDNKKGHSHDKEDKRQ